jgi:hypothetical protein
MRAAIIVPLAALALTGCQVTKDDANDSTTVQYNQDVAANAAADATNEAGNIEGYITNDVKEAGQTVKNEVGDVDVDVSRNKTANTNAH